MVGNFGHSSPGRKISTCQDLYAIFATGPASTISNITAQSFTVRNRIDVVLLTRLTAMDCIDVTVVTKPCRNSMAYEYPYA
jgi:hypothetical protein